jgi:hypothetical protein
MKSTVKTIILIPIIVMLLTLAACKGETPNGSDGELSANSFMTQTETEISTTPTEDEPAPEDVAPPSAIAQTPTPSTPLPVPTPSSMPSPSPDPTDYADLITVSEPLAPNFLTFDEAAAICSAWLEKHTEIPSYTIIKREYEPDETRWSTYWLLGEQCYMVYVLSGRDGTFEYSHVILVDAETGELLSLFRTKPDGECLTTTVERLDDWYNNELTEYAPARLTADNAIVIYNMWIDDRFANHAESLQYRLDGQLYEKYVIFGEPYYFFHANEDYMYWYNILVHMETGELLFMMTSDGMDPLTSIEPLDDWFE